MTVQVNFNVIKEKELRLRDIDTGCYVAKHSSVIHNRLIIVKCYADKDVIMVFGRDAEYMTTSDNVSDVFKTYSDWKKVDVTMEIN